MLCVGSHTVEHFSSNHQGLLVLYIIFQKQNRLFRLWLFWILTLKQDRHFISEFSTELKDNITAMDCGYYISLWFGARRADESR